MTINGSIVIADPDGAWRLEWDDAAKCLTVTNGDTVSKIEYVVTKPIQSGMFFMNADLTPHPHLMGDSSYVPLGGVNSPITITPLNDIQVVVGRWRFSFDFSFLAESGRLYFNGKPIKKRKRKR